mmetsp:Transcript_3060/g.7625  ORF Transcript_3060/g.7625 Transcript_3060/m.7625 type:complete len:206 (+) Transcript_3060:117-734(+)
MPSSCCSLRRAACFAPGMARSTSSWSTSLGTAPWSGCEQHALVHTEGKVIFEAARLVSNIRPSVSKRKQENARCRQPRGVAAEKECASRFDMAPETRSEESTRTSWSRSIMSVCVMPAPYALLATIVDTSPERGGGTHDTAAESRGSAQQPGRAHAQAPRVWRAKRSSSGQRGGWWRRVSSCLVCSALVRRSGMARVADEAISQD